VGSNLNVTVDGSDAIPAGVSAGVLNVTVVGTTAQSHMTVYPAGQILPTVSDLNWAAGRTVSNLVIATVGIDGLIDLCNFAGATDVAVDAAGWFSI
jgi:hypothetical protein